jgi:hypothetical protein
MCLSAEDEERFSVDEEGVSAVLFDEGRHGGGGGLALGLVPGKGHGEEKEECVAWDRAHVGLVLNLEDANFLAVAV